MKKKIFISLSLIISTSLILLLILFGSKTIKAKDNNIEKVFSPDICVKSPGNGETISILPLAIEEFMQMEDLLNTYPDRALEIGELTPYNDEVASWSNYLSNSESDLNTLRSIFNKYDHYYPVNNKLSWSSNIDAKEYEVIISKYKDLSIIERSYKVDGNTSSVTFINPYTGCEYFWQVIATQKDDTKVYSDIFHFYTANTIRTIYLDGVSNTRDIGGNVGFNSKRMVEGIVYRGMRLEGITDSGINEFKNELKIKTEVDLRGIGEGIENYLSLSNYYHYPSPYDYTSFTTNTSGIEYLGDGSLVKNFGNALKVFANKDNYPIYFHCSVGRDRTGWMGLCLNLLSGVSEEVALKEFILSLFSVSGSFTKGNLDFYNRYLRIRDYINTYSGSTISEKLENYLVSNAGITHEEIENIRKILLGEIDTGFIAGKNNPEPLVNLSKVTFRIYGESTKIIMVENGSLLDEPVMDKVGTWYNGNKIWDFSSDTVNEDIYLDYISKDSCKITINYNGIDLPSDLVEVKYNTNFDFSRFNKEGYKFKVYDDEYNLLTSLNVEKDLTLNVIYSPENGYIPKGNTRIIVMAGQSNGAGVGHFEYLYDSIDNEKIEEIKAGYQNVLMAGYSHGTFYDEFRPIYADDEYASSQTPGTFGFEVGLADRLSKVFPDETIYIVKYAFGGSSLNYDWISPSSDYDIHVPIDPSRERGWLYTGLVECLTNVIKTLGEETNTIPMIEAFMWMQGESDATDEIANNIYMDTFNNLISDFMNTFKDNLSYKFKIYDAAICETSVWDFAKQMNAAKRANCDETHIYIDTVSRLTTSFEPIGFVTDNAHYDAACYIDLGHMFADAYLENTLYGYTHDSLEIESPLKITLKLGEAYTMPHPKTLFNGVEVDAKMSYFSEQHKNYSNVVYSYFTVDGDVFTPIKVGETQLKITAYYNNEVRTILVPVEVIN